MNPEKSNPTDPEVNLFRQLPSISDLLVEAEALVAQAGHDRTTAALRQSLDQARAQLRAGGPLRSRAELVAAATAQLIPDHGAHVPLINATGVIIHTNLGRAPLSTAAVEAMRRVAADYSPLEFDMDTGERGQRGASVEQLLCDLTSAEAALVVNNCAAATVLMLSATARGKGVVISRGQLVEIGGGFRVPEILEQSGARLVEIGTTNRVNAADYKGAIEDPSKAVGAILRVHSSNFKIIGFTHEVALEELVGIGRARGVPVLDDLGSGSLIDTNPFGLSREPMPQDSVRAGVALTCFSGDKLLGGPQAGILIGERAAIERCRRHPFARAMRAGKLVLAGLEATLLHYARGEAAREVPVVRMMAARPAEITQRAGEVVAGLRGWLDALGLRATLIAAESTVGGGSLPGETLPTTAIAISGCDANALQTALRGARVIARIQNNCVLLDVRTVLDDGALVRGVSGVDRRALDSRSG